MYMVANEVSAPGRKTDFGLRQIGFVGQKRKLAKWFLAVTLEDARVCKVQTADFR